MTVWTFRPADRARGRVLALLGLLGLGELEVDERARRLAVGTEHHEADAERAADHLRALDRAPLEGHERRGRAAAAAAARLHHLQDLQGVLLDGGVRALQRRVEEQLDADGPRHAAAELGLRRVGAGDGLDRPDVGLGDRVLLRVERALDRLAAVDHQLRALEVLRDRHRAQPIFSPEWAISRDSVAMPVASAATLGPVQRDREGVREGPGARGRAVLGLQLDRDLLELRLAPGSSRTTAASPCSSVMPPVSVRYG